MPDTNKFCTKCGEPLITDSNMSDSNQSKSDISNTNTSAEALIQNEKIYTQGFKKEILIFFIRSGIGFVSSYVLCEFITNWSNIGVLIISLLIAFTAGLFRGFNSLFVAVGGSLLLTFISYIVLVLTGVYTLN